MQIVKNSHMELHITFALNPMKWKTEVYQNAWVREDDTHRAHGVKLTNIGIGPIQVYLQITTKEPIDDQLWEGTWPGKGWKFSAPNNYWSKWWKLGKK